MDDDFAFGSVWASDSGPSALALPSTSAFTPTQDDTGFDDGFDDFGEVQQVDLGQDGEDDDFGDFGEAEDSFANDTAQGQLPGTDSDWSALVLRPLPSRPELHREIEDILEPLWTNDDLSLVMTDDPIRDVGGINQVLVTPESRTLYQTLFSASSPPVPPPNWTRSRIRRQHLITLGIPINLDEVLPHAGGKPLPALQITTRPMSAPPGARPSPRANGRASTSASRTASRTASPASRGIADRLGLGPKPQLDEAKIGLLLQNTHDQLALMPLPVLERYLTDLHSQTSNMSVLLAYLLQTRDALQQDSEMYNKLIGELIMEAQKQKTAGKSLGRTPSRRGSGM